MHIGFGKIIRRGEINMNRSEALYKRALSVIPGGVNSPVRAFGSVGMSPRFLADAKGCRVWDTDGREYIDYIGSWGPMILGHNHPAILESVIKAAERGLSYGAATEIEVEMAEFVCEHIPSVEMIRMVNSGTEAVMSAIRLARGYTRRDKIIKFEGCYHGHSDALLVKAGSGLMTAGIPGSAGVPGPVTQDTLSAVYNDLESAAHLFEQFPDEIAAVIVEPVAANMGVILPEGGFLQGLRDLCDKYQSVLIFDEVITGFRLGFTGAQGYFGVEPDLSTYGKIIGAGMPVGAYGGKREIMELVAPCGPVYQAGTLSGNPVAMHAGLTQLKLLKEQPEIYDTMEKMANQLFGGIEEIIKRKGLPYTCNHIGTLGTLFFTPEHVTNYQIAQMSDTQKYAAYFAKMLAQGIYLAPSQFEALFVSYAHGIDEIERTLEAIGYVC